jgi:hypothetical protein
MQLSRRLRCRSDRPAVLRRGPGPPGGWPPPGSGRARPPGAGALGRVAWRAIPTTIRSPGRAGGGVAVSRSMTRSGVKTRSPGLCRAGREDALALRWRDRAVVAAQLRVARAAISMARWRPAIPLALVSDAGRLESAKRNWSFTIAMSSGFKLAATRAPTDKPGPGCGSSTWSRTGVAPDRRIIAARICSSLGWSGGPVARTAVHLAPTAIHMLVRLPVSIRC